MRQFLLTVSVVAAVSANSYGIPDAVNVTRTEAYLARRSLFEDQNAAISGPYHSELLTSAEEALNDWFVGERDEYTREHIEANDFPPNKFFYEWQGREDVIGGSVFKTLTNMPKGAALHIHSGSSGGVDWMLNEGLAMEGCYVNMGPDDPDTCVNVLGGQVVSCDSSNLSVISVLHGMIAFYDPAVPARAPPAGVGFVSTVELRENDLAGFTETMRKLISVGDFSGLKNMTSREAWAQFQPIFRITAPFQAYLPAFQAYLVNTFDILSRDGSQHVEIRAALGNGTFGGLYDLEGNVYLGGQVIEAYEGALELFQEQFPSFGGGNFTLRVIPSTLRVLPSGLVDGDLEHAFALKQAYPVTVVGFDAVSEEDTGHATVDYLSVWEAIPTLEAKYGVVMPLFFHDGESDSRNNTNLVDAILLGSHRIGHGFNAFWSPKVRHELKRRGNMPLEVCPISNQILRYVDNLQTHPAGAYIAEGLPLVLSNDDPGVFGYEGLTYDFWVAAMAWQLDLRALKVLSRNSLTYSALSDDDKDAALALWEAKWAAFVEDTLLVNDIAVAASKKLS